ncbi:MAG: serine hydrolase domain-containing protein, partial [Bacteroidota bacterium]
MKFSPIFSFALLMCCLMSVSVQAQQNSSPFTDQFQKLLEKKFDADGPGAAVLVAKNGEVIFRSSIGKANIELGVSIEPDHVFRIGSITKQFTAVAILMLMEEGKLALDDELTRFLPDYPTKGKSIDVAQLLTHTSGIPSYTSMPGFLDNYSRNHFTPEAIIDSFKNEEFDFEPNTEFRYNNSGYVLLGAIIEKISGMSYADFIQQRIFDKIGMTQSYYDDHSTIIPKRASGYEKAGDGYANASYLDMSLPYAAGSLLSTVDDLYKWQSALQADKLVKKETLQQAFTRYKLKNGEEIDYGYGWFLNKLFGEPVIEHSGGIYGFLAQGVYIPNDNIYVAVLTNCTCVSPNEVARMMAAIEMGKYSKRTPKPMSATDLKEYVGVYAFKSEEGKKVTIQVEEDHLMGQQSGGSPQSL